ncbi:hypothetical protein BDR07DRAFT_1380594 [Suillus spraguei]|nr:hypothetical protein BDR07DRAFT_1380594 [Suillus spraguei]
MVVVLIAPEFMIFWATLQLFRAYKVKKDFNDALSTQCTLRQAMSSELAIMLIGDIPNSGRHSSYEWTLTHGFFACMGGFVLYVDNQPRATLRPQELLQFIITRYAQNLPVTPLEIDTLGVAALACISYGLWFKKPKDVRHPYIIHWKSEVTAPPSCDSLFDKH